MENAETIAFQFPEFVTQCIQQEKGSKKEKERNICLPSMPTLLNGILVRQFLSDNRFLLVIV